MFLRCCRAGSRGLVRSRHTHAAGLSFSRSEPRMYRVGPGRWSEQRRSASGSRRRHLSAASADRGAATSDLADRLGLLDGVRDPEKADFYSTSMDLGRAAQMVSERGIIYEAAKSDAEKMGMKVQDYLEDITGKAESFIKSNEVVNREELQRALDGIVNRTGRFVCLLGGKSTGKSLLLENLTARHPGKVWVVDLRKDKTILRGLVRALPQRVLPETWVAIVSDVVAGCKDLTESLPEALESFRKGMSLEGAQSGLDGVLSISNSLKNALNTMQRSKEETGRPLQLVVDAMIRNLGAVTIVVDEANIAFNVGPTTDKSDIDETKTALEYFTSFTKQRKEGNVILVSSEHAFPFGLTRKPIGFNLDNFSGFLYAGEAPPKDMLRVLTEKWGVGSHLAHALVAHYGGHVWDTYLALLVLCGGEARALEVGLDPSKSSRVQACLAWRPEGQGDVQQGWMRDLLKLLATRGFAAIPTGGEGQGDVQQGRMRDLLKMLATRGFAPIPTRGDALAEVISRNNVGGVVQRGALAVGLPRDAWGGDKYGLVPATQAMRLAIAEELLREGKERGVAPS